MPLHSGSGFCIVGALAGQAHVDADPAVELASLLEVLRGRMVVAIPGSSFSELPIRPGWILS